MNQEEHALSAYTKKLQKQLTYTLIVTVYCIKNIGAITLLHFSVELRAGLSSSMSQSCMINNELDVGSFQYGQI
jgi:hypothetical protein